MKQFYISTKLSRHVLAVFTIIFFIFHSLQVSAQDSANILHYDLHLDLTNISGKTINGYTDISFHPSQSSLDGIRLELLELIVDSVRFNGLNHSYTYNDTVIQLMFAAPVSQSDTSMIRIYYHGIPHVEPNNWGGFHFSGSGLAYNLGIALVEEPHNFGRVWFPCIDNFTEKAAYDFHITTAGSLMAVCNGMLTDSVHQSNGTISWHWQLREEIPAYLASVAVSNYVAVRGDYAGLLDTIPTYLFVKPQDTTKAKNSFIHLNQVLSHYEECFGPYPWPRVGYVSTPIGAMEHATNIAYPSACIDGTLDDENLYSHELSHSWFGDLITCSSAADMWINEGWAVYCESIMKEGVYGKTAFHDNIRKELHATLQRSHINDNAYRALYGIPGNYTYGSTVYDKGGMVVHCLRGYLGDSLFFSVMRQFLDTFAFKSVSTHQLRDFITQSTGIDMQDFFNTWVFEAGFPHFSIDTFYVIQSGSSYYTNVFLRQRHKGTSYISNENHIELAFLGQNFERETHSFIISGELDSISILLPFHPIEVIADPEERLADATTDYSIMVKSPGLKVFPDTYFSTDVLQVIDSAYIHVVHNWVPPDSLIPEIPGLRISPYRYWTVQGIFPQGFTAKGKFSYSKFNYLDNTLINNSLDSVVLFYKKNCHSSWQAVDFTMNGQTVQGELIVDTLKTGLYTLGLWDHTYLGNPAPLAPGHGMHISPNPSKGSFKITLDVEENTLLNLVDGSGKVVDSIDVPAHQKVIYWAPAVQSDGTYIMQLIGPGQGVINSEKVLIQH